MEREGETEVGWRVEEVDGCENEAVVTYFLVSFLALLEDADWKAS